MRRKIDLAEPQLFNSFGWHFRQEQSSFQNGTSPQETVRSSPFPYLDRRDRDDDCCRILRSESRAVYIKMDISSFEIWCNSLPECNIGLHPFHCTPCGETDSFTVHPGRDKQQFELPVFILHLDNYSSDWPSVLHYSICFTDVDRFFNRPAWNNLSVLFKMFIPAAEFDQSSVVECLLVIAYELLTIIWS